MNRIKLRIATDESRYRYPRINTLDVKFLYIVYSVFFTGNSNCSLVNSEF
jgi:hypothetical protein